MDSNIRLHYLGSRMVYKFKGFALSGYAFISIVFLSLSCIFKSPGCKTPKVEVWGSIQVTRYHM